MTRDGNYPISRSPSLFLCRASVQTAVSIISPEFDDPDQLLDHMNHQGSAGSNASNHSNAEGGAADRGIGGHPPPHGVGGHHEPMGAIVEDPDADGNENSPASKRFLSSYFLIIHDLQRKKKD